MSADWTTLISSVGFPIVAFLMVYLDLRKKLEALTTEIVAFKVEVSALKTAVERLSEKWVPA